MNTPAGEVIIVGAGPAGVSAAWALCERGVSVTMLDAGASAVAPPPDGQYLNLRFTDRLQWKWQIGEDYSGLAANANASPKLRVPRFGPMFKDYSRANQLRVESEFKLLGALAVGGLSNAWGCGVARFDDADLGDLAADNAAMQGAYARVAGRMGLSGSSDDPLRSYFGLDQWADAALQLDSLHARLWSRRKRLAHDEAFRMGRSRVAVLAQDRTGRSACDFSGTCLWGCARHATWSAALELDALSRQPGFRLHSGVRVDRLHKRSDSGYDILAMDQTGKPCAYRAEKILLGAGTIATTRLVLAALPDPPLRLRLLSNPMAAFLLLLPRLLGTPRDRAFGLAQLSFVLDDAHEGETAMGSLFSTAGLPVTEFLAHLPITRRSGLPLLRALLPATVVGNLFMPGSLSDHWVGIDSDGGLRIQGGATPALAAAMTSARNALRRRFRRLGGWMLPGSFTQAAAGADIHYAGTLPIKTDPKQSHQCRMNGEVTGLPGVHVIDGASLPRLPAKAHTLTIMANADRIASALRVER